MPTLGPKIIYRKDEPTTQEIARAVARGTVFGCAIKELEEMWADESGPMYMRSSDVSARAIHRIGALELGRRRRSVTEEETARRAWPVVVSRKQLDAFLEGFCSILPGPYVAELPTVAEDRFVAKFQIFHDHSVEILNEHRSVVSFLEEKITRTLSTNIVLPIKQELSLFDFANSETVYEPFATMQPATFFDPDAVNRLRVYEHHTIC